MSAAPAESSGLSLSRSLRPYQQRAVERLVSGAARGLWLACGLGKTAVALAAWSSGRAETPVLVLTRAIGRHVWGRDAAWVCPDVPVAVLWGRQQRRTGRHLDGSFTSLDLALAAAPIVVTNYEVLEARYDELSGVPWRLIILDEAHAIKMGYQKPGKVRLDDDRLVLKRTRYHYAKGLAYLAYSRRGEVWELTATPVRDRIRDLYGQLDVLQPAQWGSAWQFLHRYCAARPGKFGGLDTTGSSNLAELRERLGRLFVVETRATVASELPTATRDVKLVTPEERFRAEEVLGERTVYGGGVEEAVALAAAQKTPLAIDLAIDYLAGRGKVVLVTSRRKLAAQLHAALAREAKRRLPAAVMRELWLCWTTGETSISARTALAQEYQSRRDCACLVATADCLMESIDLQQTDALIFCALPYTPYALTQMEGRVVRLGGRPVTIVYLVAQGTIDDRIRTLVLDKLGTVVEVGADTQGAGGVSEALRSCGRSEAEILAELRGWLEKTSEEEDGG